MDTNFLIIFPLHFRVCASNSLPFPAACSTAFTSIKARKYPPCLFIPVCGFVSSYAQANEWRVSVPGAEYLNQLAPARIVSPAYPSRYFPTHASRNNDRPRSLSPPPLCRSLSLPVFSPASFTAFAISKHPRQRMHRPATLYGLSAQAERIARRHL